MPRVGWLEFDAENTEGEVFKAWPDALDMEPGDLENKLVLGYRLCVNTLPKSTLAAATDPGTGTVLDPAPEWKQAQILGARYYVARLTAGNGDTRGADEYTVQDTSRKMYLDMRDLLRPRVGLGGFC